MSDDSDMIQHGTIFNANMFQTLSDHKSYEVLSKLHRCQRAPLKV